MSRIRHAVDQESSQGNPVNVEVMHLNIWLMLADGLLSNGTPNGVQTHVEVWEGNGAFLQYIELR
jgi:hypothetical protein